MTLFFLLFNSISFAGSSVRECVYNNEIRAEQLNYSTDPRWRDILHMREGLLSPYSEADGPRFFLSSRKASPKEELSATIRTFCENKTLETDAPAIPKIQARCQFPAREQLLESEGFGGWDKPVCTELNDWKNKVGREKVSLVFSSYYANNPSSVFGHTLLRFDRIQSESGELFSPLLSYGINFAGETTTSNPVLYAILGMVGGFKGKFASLPYYYKVREYSDFDSRDLWEYQLNLSTEQIEMLLNHIWEQGFSHYDYFYFTENCSYHLLTSLDVAAPSYKLDQKVPYWVIPVDTVKAVTNKSPGLVSNIGFRPSLYRQFLTRLKRLEDKKIESSFYTYLSEGPSSIESLSTHDKAYVMDTVLDYWDFKHSKDLLEVDSAASKQKAEFLKVRAALPLTEKLKFDGADFERPDDSHETLRVGIAGGHSSYLGSELEFDLRFALHDLLDPQKGYPSTAKIEFFRVTGSYFEEKKQFKITEAKFFDVQLISPLKRFERSMSWRALIGLDRSFYDCDFCLGGRTLMQGGAAFGLSDDKFIFYGLLGGDFIFSPQHRSADFLALPVATAGLRIRGPKDINLLLENDFHIASFYALPNGNTFRSEARKAFGLQWALGAEYSKQKIKRFENDIYKISGFHYF